VKILLDQNAPRPLASFLAGHAVVRSAAVGWARLKNGELLRAAEAEGFDLLITADRNLVHQQNLMGRSVALVILPSGQWPVIRPHIATIVRAVHAATPGSFQKLSL
jgi:hypothetical protein